MEVTSVKNAPLFIKIIAKTIPFKKYDDSENLATGEIKIFKGCSDLAKKAGIVGTEENYSIIWEHIFGDYFKEVSKTYDYRRC